MSLYRNINKRKKAGTSRSKKNSTISDKAYANMKAGFPKKKKKKTSISKNDIHGYLAGRKTITTEFVDRINQIGENNGR